MLETRTCQKCNETLPLEEHFHTYKKKLVDGTVILRHRNTCKGCALKLIRKNENRRNLVGSTKESHELFHTLATRPWV